MYEVLINIGTTTTITTTTTTSTISSSTTTTATTPTITSIAGTSGTFNSVNYPSNYFDDYEEQYIITVKDGSKIALYFESFDLEYHVGCIYDYIEVYDSDGTVIVKACGKSNPIPVTSSSNNLKLIFKADNSRNATGFKAIWTTESDINSIQSPNYPLLYPNDANEVHTLAVEEGWRISITFLFFELQDDYLCRADWVELISDNYKSRHCGQTTKPWSIITNSNFITIRFSSSYRNPYTGFLAIWSPTTAPPTYPSSIGCEDCTFPFVSNDRVFDTCTSIDGDQPWCQVNPPGPID